MNMKSFMLYLSERILLVFATNVIFCFFAYLELYTPTVAYLVFLTLLASLLFICIKVNKNIDIKNGLFYLSFPIAWLILKDFPLMDFSYALFPQLEAMDMKETFTFTVTLIDLSADLWITMEIILAITRLTIKNRLSPWKGTQKAQEESVYGSAEA